MKDNLTTIGFSIIFVLVVLGIFCTKNIVARFSETENSLTKAICDEKKYCEDYQIVCKGNELMELNPTGAIVQFSENWKDPRTQEDKKIGCN